MNSKEIGEVLHSAFCRDFVVNSVPDGYAISTPFEDGMGDRLSFYLTVDEEGMLLEDGGFFLSELHARGIDVGKGQRLSIIHALTSAAKAVVDEDSLEVSRRILERSTLPEAMVSFTSALLGLRVLEHFSAERVRSTFREDVRARLDAQLSVTLEIEESVAPSASLADFPADFVLTSRVDRTIPAVALYTISSRDRVNEALLLHQEIKMKGRPERVIALLESTDLPLLRGSAFQRAQNRGLQMPIFRGDEEQSIARIGEIVLQPAA